MNTPEDIARTATVHWAGDVAHGHGTIATQSGLVKADYSFGTRFSGDPGTNPEELLAASHASCFTMALSAALTRAGHPPTAIDTTAVAHLHRSADGFDISQITLKTTVVAPGLEEETLQELANGAKAGCPISKALKTVPMTLEATLKT